MCVAGGTLADRFKAQNAPPDSPPSTPRPPLTPALRLRIALRLAEALQELHLQQPPITHRSIHPSNVLFDGAEQVWLSDFAVQREWWDPALKEHDSSDGVVATDPYRAPEQWDVHHLITPASDVFSFGVIVHELWTGKLPE